MKTTEVAAAAEAGTCFRWTDEMFDVNEDIFHEYAAGDIGNLNIASPF